MARVFFSGSKSMSLEHCLQRCWSCGGGVFASLVMLKKHSAVPGAFLSTTLRIFGGVLCAFLGGAEKNNNMMSLEHFLSKYLYQFAGFVVVCFCFFGRSKEQNDVPGALF